VEVKLCVLVYRCLHGLGPEYLFSDFTLMIDILTRQRLRSAAGASLVIPVTWQRTLGDRAFPAAAAQAWNALPPNVTSAPSPSSGY